MECYEAKIVDLRSDTLTLPTREMRESVLEAPLGDDVFGEDPSVIALQRKVAEILGKEDALFVPSGTMGNLICVMNHCWERGSEVILGDQTHINVYEQGGIAQLGGVHCRTVKNLPDGTFRIEEMESLVRPENIHFPVTSLVCIENTHNLMGGKVLPLEWVDKVGAKCKELGLPLHVDGARLFNAAVALNVTPARLVKDAASVSICLSKGLGAPVGSVIAASSEFIQRALRLRKVLGGGMRQSGVLASMGMVALNNRIKTIQDDHRRLALLANGISEMKSPFLSPDLEGRLSNILLLNLKESFMTASELVSRLCHCSEQEAEALKERIVCRILPRSSPTVARMVLHCNITDEDIARVLKKIRYILQEATREMIY